MSNIIREAVLDEMLEVLERSPRVEAFEEQRAKLYEILRQQGGNVSRDFFDLVIGRGRAMAEEAFMLGWAWGRNPDVLLAQDKLQTEGEGE